MLYLVDYSKWDNINDDNSDNFSDRENKFNDDDDDELMEDLWAPGDVAEIFGLTSDAGKLRNEQMGMLTEWIEDTG